MAQYQPFVLQVQRPGPKFSTGEKIDKARLLTAEELANANAQVWKPGSEVQESSQSNYWQRAWMVATAALCVVAFVLFLVLLVVPLGRTDKMTNTKSMHFARNKKRND
jgi:hypothetical protein